MSGRWDSQGQPQPWQAQSQPGIFLGPAFPSDQQVRDHSILNHIW